MSKKSRRLREVFLDQTYAQVHSTLLAAPVTPPVTTASREAVIAIRAAMTACCFAPIDIHNLPKPITVVVAGNGVFEVRTNVVGVTCRQLSKGTHPGFPDMVERWTPRFPRFPWGYLQSVVAFLRWVKSTYDSEGLIRAYWQEVGDGGAWSLHVPAQIVSGAAVKVAIDEPDPGLGVFAVEIHSHPGTSSVFSGVDNVDDRQERIYGCVADLKEKALPNFHWRIGTGFEAWIDVGIEEVVDGAGEPVVFKMAPLACLAKSFTFNPFETDVPFPDEWKAQVSPESKSPVVYNGGMSEGYQAYLRDRRIDDRSVNPHGWGDRGRATATMAELQVHFNGCARTYDDCVLCAEFLRATNWEKWGGQYEGV